MKKVFFLFVVLLILVGFGCTTVYTHSSKSNKDFERDKRECDAYAKRILASRGIPET